MNDNQPPSHQEEQPEAEQQGDSETLDPETVLNTEQEEPGAGKRDKVDERQQDTEEGGAWVCDEEAKGVKRKREELPNEDEAEQSTEKKKVKMSSLLLSII